MRKHILGWLACLALCPSPGSAAPAEITKEVQFIVPAGPGGSLDAVARKLQELLVSHKLVRDFIVLNKPGASTQVALNVLDQHAGDPHYLMTLATSMVNNNYLGNIKVSYKDYTPVAMLLDGYVGVLVRSDSPFKTAQDLVEHLKKTPDDLNIAIAATLGNDVHVGVAKPLMHAGVDISKLTFVPFKSSGESITNLIGGNVDVVGATTPTIIPALQTGKVRLLVIGSPERLQGVLSDTPTWKELGIDVITSSPQGVLAPKGISPEQVKFWEAALKQVSDTEEWRAFLEKNQWAPRYLNARDTNDMLAAETRSVEEVLSKLKVGKARAGK
ncbi:tripartite tricarboxylate transporter substrate binding protein [Bordetella petrii]|nr:tripartite tricarboxylate transporter substrate binding protein [Bordetella petrii]